MPFRVRKEDEMSLISKFSEMIGFKSQFNTDIRGSDYDAKHLK